MPFGLCNAPATFERFFAGLLIDVCLVYLDDNLVPGRSVEEELINLRNMFKRLLGARLKLSPEKCTLFQREVKYLGHILSGAGISMDPDKKKAIQTWPVPTTAKEVRSFLNLCSYYHRFISGFADIAQPSHHFSEKRKPFVWTPDAERAFQQLKCALSKAQVLGYPLPRGKFLVNTDAGDVGIGAVLSQLQDGQEQVEASYSRALTQTE